MGNSPFGETEVKTLKWILFATILVSYSLTNCFADYDPEDPKNLALLDAVGQNNSVEVERLLKEGANPNTINVKRETALGIAARNGYAAVLKLLLDAGANLDSGSGWSALRSSAIRGHVEVVRMLLKAGAKVNDSEKDPILEEIIGQNEPARANLEVIEELIKYGADVNAPTHQDITPIEMAAIRKRLDIIAVLEKAGANKEPADKWWMVQAAMEGDLHKILELVQGGVSVNCESWDGTTPVRAAIWKNQLQIFDQLIVLGADPNYANKKGSTPLMASLGEGKELFFQKLLKLKVDVNHEDNDGRTALMYAAKAGDWGAVEKLLKAGADVAHQDRNGDPAIAYMLAYQHDLSIEQTNALKMLIDFGADVNWRRGGEGYSILNYAVKTETKLAVEMLRQRGAKLVPVDQNDINEAFYYKNLKRLELYILAGFDVVSDPRWLNSAAESNVEVVRLLLKAGANPTAKGSYALSAAVSKGNLEVVKELMKAGATPQVSDLETAVNGGYTEIAKVFEERGLQSADIKKIQLRRDISLKLQNENETEIMDLFKAYQQVAGPSEAATQLQNIAGYFYAKKKFDTAERLCLKIINDYPGNTARIWAWYQLGEIESQKGNEQSSLQYYVKAAQGSSVQREFNEGLPFDYGRAEAIEKLINYYVSKSDCETATYWLKLYQLNGYGCGTGQMSAENWKNQQIAICEIKRGNTSDGIAKLENMVFANPGEVNLESITYLIDYYDSQGKLDEIEKKFPDGNQLSIYGNTPLYSEYIKLLRAIRNKDVVVLAQYLETYPQHPFAKKAMTQFLQLGEPAEQLALQKLNNGEDLVWVSYVLGKMKVKKAIDPIIALVRVEKRTALLNYYFQALALMEDPAATDVIEKYASEGSGYHQIAAKDILEKMKAGTLTEFQYFN